MKNRSITTSEKWRPIPLDANLMAKGAQEGLLGIEELVDYTLITKSKRGKPKKRSFEAIPLSEQTSSEEEELEIGEEEEEEDNVAKKRKVDSAKKKKKKKKKKKTKQKTEVVWNDGEEDILEFEPDSSEMESEDCNDYDESKMSEWSALFVPIKIKKALYELGFHTPTPIQRMTLPASIKARMDVVGAAETGSGKTLAFGIPILNGILNDLDFESSKEDDNLHKDDSDDNDDYSDELNEPMEMENEIGCVKVIDNVEFDFALPSKTSSKKLRALILTPTRELAVQVKNHIISVAKYTGIKIAAIFGGMAPQKQVRILSKGPDIVVATPGRLWDLIQEGNPHLNQVKDIKYLAIDETDRMVEKGHFEELGRLLELINEDEEKKKQRQNFVFSATLTMVHEAPKRLASKKRSLTSEEKLRQISSQIGIKPKAKIVDITRKIGTAEGLTESRIHCDLTDKDIYLYYFIQQHRGRTLIFCNSIDCVRRLVNLFQLLLCEPMGLHAQMHQKQRLKNLERFSENDAGILIATDVAARGLDIPDVQHVVHYQVPRTSESYVHRSGRTARADNEGISVMLIEPKETHFYKKIRKTLNRDEDIPIFPVDSGLLSGIRERVNAARLLDKLTHTLKKEEVSKSWWKKAAEEAELEYSEDDEEEDVPNSGKITKLQIDQQRIRLHRLLAVPITNSGFSGKYPTKSGKLQTPSYSKTSAISTVKNEGLKAQKILQKKRSKRKKKLKC